MALTGIHASGNLLPSTAYPWPSPSRDATERSWGTEVPIHSTPTTNRRRRFEDAFGASDGQTPLEVSHEQPSGPVQVLGRREEGAQDLRDLGSGVLVPRRSDDMGWLREAKLREALRECTRVEFIVTKTADGLWHASGNMAEGAWVTLERLHKAALPDGLVVTSYVLQSPSHIEVSMGLAAVQRTPRYRLRRKRRTLAMDVSKLNLSEDDEATVDLLLRDLHFLAGDLTPTTLTTKIFASGAGTTLEVSGYSRLRSHYIASLYVYDARWNGTSVSVRVPNKPKYM